MKHYLFIFILFFVTEFARTQPRLEKNFTYTHYTTYDGLTQSQVTFMYQCSKGYLWICTKEGISRFDGKSFKNFVGDGLDNFNSIYDIFEHDGFYYMMSSNCMYRYQGSELQNLKRIPYPENLKIGDSFLEKYLDENTLYLFNLQKVVDKNKNFNHFEYNLFSHKSKPISFSTKRIKKAYKSKGKLLAINDSCYFIKTNTWSNEKPLTHHYNRFRQGNNEIIGKQKKKQKLYKLSYENDTLLEIPLDLKTDIAFHKGDYFVDFGPNQIIYADANYQIFLNNNGKIKKLASLTMITCYLKDKEGNLWVGTEDGIYNFHQCLFESYKFNVGNKVDNVWSILQDQDKTMWFSGYNTGIWNLKNQSVNLFDKNKLGLNEWEQSIFNMQYMGGTTDSGGRVYFPYVEHILLLSKNQTKIIKQSPQTSLYLYNDEKNHQLISLGAHGNCIINKDTWRINRIPNETATIVSCVPLSDDQFLLGSYHHQYILEKQRITALPDTFQYNGVIAMTRDSIGNIWKGTTSGLYLSTTNMEQRIAPNIIKGNIPSVYRYKDYLFATSKNELFALNLDHFYKTGIEKIKIYNYHNGFKAMDCGQNGFFLDHDGYLWFPVVDKVLRFKPEDIFETINKKTLHTTITTFETHSKQIGWLQSFQKTDTTYNSKTDGMSFQFYSSCFNAPEKIVYRYRLNGLDKQWSQPTSKTFVRYNNLKDGKYQLLIQSSIDHSNWSETETSPTITIKKHWTKTVVFASFVIILVLIFIIASTLFLYRKKEQNKLKKLVEQKRLNELRLQSIRSKHIPHFSGNALSNIEAFIFDADLRQANKFLSKYSRMMNITLRDADKASRSIVAELEYVSLYLELEKIRFQEKINYQINVDEKVDQMVQLPNMLIHTWVENAIKHGLRHADYPWNILIEISQHKNMLLIAVEDNGIGIEKSKEYQTHGSGNGLKILEEQLKIYNSFNPEKAAIMVNHLNNNEAGKGTRFELEIPIDYQYNI